MKIDFGFDDRANKTANEMVIDLYPDIGNDIEVSQLSTIVASIIIPDGINRERVIGWEFSSWVYGAAKKYFFSFVYDIKSNIFYYQVLINS